MKKECFDRCIRLIEVRLKKLQRSNGSWANNNFINALTAYSISEMEVPKRMLNKSLDFILSRKKIGWSWNYCPEEKYPDDLDDTFCSLIAIHKIRPEIIDETARANIADLLAHAEKEKNGPYFTWANGIWNDVDPIVNANISCFAALSGATMPNVTKYIDRCIGAGTFDSKYYHNPFLAYYFIARNYRGTKKAQLIRIIRNNLKKERLRKNKISGINEALAACALVHLGQKSRDIYPLVKKIPKMDLTEALYIEKISDGKTHYARSPAFTLAVCGEALSLYMKMARKINESKKKNRERKIGQKISRRIRLLAERRCTSMSQPLRTEALTTLRKTLETDRHSTITLLPYRSVISLSDRVFSASLQTACVSCGLLSLYGWMAYSIYDRIIDGKENSRMLPVAHAFHREMCLLYEKSSRTLGKEISRIGDAIFDAMDCAELREIKNNLDGHTQFPSKRQTIEKSIGFLIPSTLALVHAGLSPHGPDLKKYMRFFKHYIFIKQTSDDIRDWRDDMRNGIATRVTARMVDADNSKSRKHVIVSSVHEIIEHTRLARTALGSARSFSKDSFLFELIDRHACTAEKILKKMTSRTHKLDS